MPAPSLCVVSGVVYEVDGTPAVGVTLFLKRVLLNGVLIGTAPIGTASIPQLAGGDHTIQYIEAITSIAGGVVSFTVPQLSTVYLEGNVSGYNNGEIALSIPATATATLEALTPATFPIDVTTFTFLSLVDTPDDFTGQALKNVRVNAAGTALEFSAPVVVDNETVQDALSAFFPDVAPFDWTYDDAGDRVTLAILDATASARGLMSTAYAARLDSLSLTAGSIPFGVAGGLLGQDNANLFFDDTNNRLGIGTASPSSILHINSAAAPAIKITDSDSGSGVGVGDGFDFQMAGLEAYLWNYEAGGVHLAAGNAERLTILSTGLVGINKSASLGAQLHTLSNAIGVIPFKAEGPAGQTANLAEFAVNGVAKCTITASGGISLASGGSIVSGGSLTALATGNIFWAARGGFSAQSDGVLTAWNNAGSDFNRLQFGGTTAAFPSLKRSGTVLQFRTASDSAYAETDALEYRASGTKVVGVQGAAVIDATDNPSAITQLNALLARLRAHGLIAT